MDDEDILDESKEGLGVFPSSAPAITRTKKVIIAALFIACIASTVLLFIISSVESLHQPDVGAFYGVSSREKDMFVFALNGSSVYTLPVHLSFANASGHTRKYAVSLHPSSRSVWAAVMDARQTLAGRPALTFASWHPHPGKWRLTHTARASPALNSVYSLVNFAHLDSRLVLLLNNRTAGAANTSGSIIIGSINLNSGSLSILNTTRYAATADAPMYTAVISSCAYFVLPSLRMFLRVDSLGHSVGIPFDSRCVQLGGVAQYRHSIYVTCSSAVDSVFIAKVDHSSGLLSVLAHWPSLSISALLPAFSIDHISGEIQAGALCDHHQCLLTGNMTSMTSVLLSKETMIPSDFLPQIFSLPF